jgi:hypothetical protein
MSELSDLLAQGFDEALAQAGSPISGAAGGTASGIVSPLVKSKALRDSGLMAEVESTVELTRAAAQTVGLLDADGKPIDRAHVIVGAVTFLAMVFEDDPSDPMIRVHLKRYRGR